jgi:TonB dependent receptor/TonB-dependent Receptor Plug Domain
MRARSIGAVLGATLLLTGFFRPVWAQDPSVPATDRSTTTQELDGDLIDRLPVDRLGAALLWLPGITDAGGGAFSLRGSRFVDVATYLDGIPVSPGYRKTGFGFDLSSTPSPGQSFHEFGTNAFELVSVTTGPLSTMLGNAQAGVVAIQTHRPKDRLDARGSFESESPFGNGNGSGLNRFQGLASGRIASRFSFMGAAVIEGHEASLAGRGAEDVPLFVSAGLDTTVAVPSAIGDPLADTTLVSVNQYAIYRGHCDAFASSTNPDIAENLDEECHGGRFPSSGTSNHQLLGRVDYRLGNRSALWLTGSSNREQIRLFDPFLMEVPSSLTALQGSSRLVTLGAEHRLSPAGQPLSLRAAVSFQRDQTIGGPLTPESEIDSRDGMLLSSLDFAYDFKSFPVNDELVENIRGNIPGSRQSPLDLQNVSQYDFVNRYRNSAYGLDGGPESGGPAGRLTLLRENRTVAAGAITWQPSGTHQLIAGVELTRFSISSYSHDLQSQAFSDVFIEDPVRSALYLESHIRFSDVMVTGGVRYDRFRSDADRTFVLDTVASSPTFNTYSYFPSPNSYGAGGITFNGQPLVKTIADEARSALSPRIRVAFSPLPAATFRLGVARQAQMPDLSMVLSGVNTDLRVTNTSHVFGGDLDLERTTIFEGGIHYRVNPTLTVDGAVYHKELDDQAVPRLVSHPDPARLGENVDIRQFTSLGLGQVTGFDLSANLRSRVVSGIFGYGYQKTESGFDVPAALGGGVDAPLAESRPHTLTAAVAVQLPGDWHPGSLEGTILQNVGVYAGFRFSSGTAYTRCPAEFGNESVFSGETCARSFEGDFLGARLPSVKQLDLRITKGFSIAGHQLIAYLDGRNILNFENVLRVFATTGKTTNPEERQLLLQQDSASFGNEAISNGVYGADGSIDLRFGGSVASGCGNWVNSGGEATAPNCVYLIRAEERFGDGDHVFTLAEQQRAAEARYLVFRGQNNFVDSGRRVRLGLEVRF